MAVERTLNVAELIEGKKLAWPQIGIALWLCTLMVLEGYDMQTLSFAAPSILREWQVSRADCLEPTMPSSATSSGGAAASASSEGYFPSHS